MLGLDQKNCTSGRLARHNPFGDHYSAPPMHPRSAWFWCPLRTHEIHTSQPTPHHQSLPSQPNQFTHNKPPPSVIITVGMRALGPIIRNSSQSFLPRSLPPKPSRPREPINPPSLIIAMREKSPHPSLVVATGGQNPSQNPRFMPSLTPRRLPLTLRPGCDVNTTSFV